MDNLSAAWLYPIILIAGALQAWGPPVNNALKNALVNPWLSSSLVSFLPIVAWSRRNFPLEWVLRASGFALLLAYFFIIVHLLTGKHSHDCERVSQSTWEQQHAEIKVDFRAFDGYVGQYKLASGEMMTVTQESGRLLEKITD